MRREADGTAVPDGRLERAEITARLMRDRMGDWCACQAVRLDVERFLVLPVAVHATRLASVGHCVDVGTWHLRFHG